ncbi:MAG: 4a-hydroxytetrahydrobiopterin dehydratase [Terriglobia bacterium]
MPALSDAEVRNKLGSLPGWQLKGKAIEKKYELISFLPAIQFVQKLAELAEAEQHHPDITINYNAVTLKLSTHSQGGVTEKDLELAGKIEKLPRN